MRFAVTNTGGYEMLQTYKDMLTKYNLEVTEVGDTVVPDDSGDELTEIFHISLGSLEELNQLKDDLGSSLIICDEFFDEFSQVYKELTIKIYDDYI